MFQFVCPLILLTYLSSSYSTGNKKSRYFLHFKKIWAIFLFYLYFPLFYCLHPICMLFCRSETVLFSSLIFLALALYKLLLFYPLDVLTHFSFIYNHSHYIAAGNCIIHYRERFFPPRIQFSQQDKIKKARYMKCKLISVPDCHKQHH